MKKISLVFSFKNEENNLEELIKRVDASVKKLKNYNYELIFVNDASDDNSEKILENVDDILDDKAKFVEQDHAKATYAKKIEKKEGQIDWNDEAKNIIGKVNGLFPTPGAFFNFNGERYKILKAEIGNGIGKFGEVISDKLEIACSNNQSVKILEIQRQGKKPQKIGEFMLGSKIKKGLIIS